MTADAQRIIDKYYPGGSALRDIYIRHCRSVAELALRINTERHLGLDPETVETAAMLHDIGIFKTDADGIQCFGSEPYIRHGIIGAELLRDEGIPEEIARVAERHTGAGISREEIIDAGLPLPHRDMLPVSVEEQVICYADKFFSKSRRLDEEKPVEKILLQMAAHSQDSAARFAMLHSRFGDQDQH